VLKLTKPYPNACVYSLDNEYKTASSPRNHGLDKANGTYIGFLDADDWLEPLVYEIALQKIQESKADIAGFHFQQSCADESVQTVPPFTLLDQTKDVIIANREDLNSPEYTHIMGLAVWSKVFRRDFLEKHALRFDDEIPFTEDTLFCIECFDKAKTVCFLPQLIGYNYFIHAGSMVQNTAKPPEEVVRIARGMSKTFKRGLECGMFMSGLIWGHLCFQAAILLTCTDLTMSERKQVRALLSPYLKTEKMSVEYALKSYGVDGKMMATFPKTIIGHPRFSHILVSLMKMLKVDLAAQLKNHDAY